MNWKAFVVGILIGNVLSVNFLNNRIVKLERRIQICETYIDEMVEVPAFVKPKGKK